MDEKKVAKTIVEGEGKIVLDEKTFDKVRKLLPYDKEDAFYPHRFHGIPIIWIEGGFVGLKEVKK